MTELFKPINTLKGVGKKRAEAFEKLRIDTPYDLLYFFPRSYLDFSASINILDAPLEQNSVVRGVVTKKLGEQIIRRTLSIYKAIITDYNTEFTVVIFNNFYAYDALKVGEEYCFYGKVTGTDLRREINSPKIIKVDGNSLIQPIYRLTDGLTVAMVMTNVREALAMLESEPIENLPQDIIKEQSLVSLTKALSDIHFPPDQDGLENARKRLAFDELLILQLGMQMLKYRNQKKCGCSMQNKDVRPFLEGLPFQPTNAQYRCVDEICKDMCLDTPMNRLLQGDVGSGKTLVAATACLFAHYNGYQSALMAPTELLANQHYDTLRNFLKPYGVKIMLLTGSLTPKKKQEVKGLLASGECDIVVGTHAIIQKSTEFKSLGLVITDEQHRFGVAQRAALAAKGEHPHNLVMSATPIPRTVSLIIYGELDISVLDEMPKGRIPIETYAITGKVRNRAYNFVRERLDEGRQAYIVCPMIDESDNELLAVTEYADRISREDFANYRVGLLHGRLTSEEKESTMQKFKAGEIDVLVSTTVVEVGVDVPNAVIMMIENSERFGLSQLHQLRGRVGRGDFKSYCILISDNINDETRTRLKIMSNTSDGFVIAEEDLKLRGPGDFFKERQHGLPSLKIANTANDMEIIREARDVAIKIISEDCELTSPKNSGLKIDILRLFEKNGQEQLN